MAEARPKSFTAYYKTAEQLSPEFDTGPLYPERRLWIAVIVQALVEYEELLRNIHKTWEAFRRPIHRSFYWSIRQIKHEAQDPWFGHICDMADVSQAVVVQKLSALDKKYKFGEVEFTDDHAVPTRYYIRKHKKERGL